MRLPAVVALERAAAALRSPLAVVLVDGRSGSGKSTFAELLVARTPASVLHLEDLYPGWEGLDAGADAVVRDVLRPRRAGAGGAVRRWDWLGGRRGALHRLPAAGGLIVEGCGAIRPSSAPFADLTVWLELDPVRRRTRALGRDGDVFRPHWSAWARQEDRAIARDHPRRLAALHVDGGSVVEPSTPHAARTQ